MNTYTYLGLDTVNGWLIGEDKITEDDFFKFHHKPKNHIDVETLIDTNTITL